MTAGELMKQMEVGDYVTLVEGDNKFRFLENPIDAVRYWVTIKDETGKVVKRPKTLREDEPIDVGELEVDDKGKTMINDIKIVPVYNFAHKQIQILVLHQKTIKTKLERFKNNPKLSDMTKYNIIVNRTGTTQMDTEYDVVNDPIDADEEKELEPIFKQYKDRHVDMSRIFSSKAFPYGGHPLSMKDMGNDNSKSVEKTLDNKGGLPF